MVKDDHSDNRQPSESDGSDARERHFSFERTLGETEPLTTGLRRRIVTTMRGLSLAAAAAIALATLTCVAAGAAQARILWTAADKTAARLAAHHEADRLAERVDATGWPTNVRSVT